MCFSSLKDWELLRRYVCMVSLDLAVRQDGVVLGTDHAGLHCTEAVRGELFCDESQSVLKPGRREQLKLFSGTGSGIRRQA